MKVFKIILKKIMASPLIWYTVGGLVRKKGVVVLMYHRISVEKNLLPSLPLDIFSKQMYWLNKYCNIIDSRSLNSPVRNYFKPTVLITFDDGQRCIHDVVYPILKKLNIPAIVFLATKYMDEGGLIWTDEISWAILESKKNSINLPWNPKHHIKFKNLKDREKVEIACKKYLKSLPDSERKYWQILLLQELGISKKMMKVNREMLNWDEVRACKDVFEFGGHTHNHPIMSRLDNENLNKEILTCRNRIRDELGIVPTIFAYPNGEAQDYNDNCKKLLTKHGFKIAFTTIEGINTEFTNLLELKRIPTTAPKIEDLAWMILRA